MTLDGINNLIRGKVILKMDSYSNDNAVNRIYFTDRTYLILYSDGNDRVLVELRNELGNKIGGTE